MTKNHTTSDSDAPASVTVDGKSVRVQVGIKWARRIIITMLSLASAGGVGWVGINIATIKPAAAAELMALDKQNSKDHDAIRQTQSADHAMTVVNDTAVKNLTQEVGGIKSVLSRDVARKEAHRLTDDIRDRRRSAFEYDRIFEMNLRRLAAGKDPCGTLECQ